MTQWKRGAVAHLAYHLLLVILGLVGALLLVAGLAHGHGPHMTAEQQAWLERQRARDGTKCCDVTDVHVGLAVEWRLDAQGYQVRIGEAWHRVPPGRLLAPIEGDPSPFGSQALLFRALYVGAGLPTIYCFLPEPLM